MVVCAVVRPVADLVPLPGLEPGPLGLEGPAVYPTREALRVPCGNRTHDSRL